MKGSAGSLDVIVVGAGPACLAASRELARRGADPLVLERGFRIGHTWDKLYDGLVLHTGNHLSVVSISDAALSDTPRCPRICIGTRGRFSSLSERRKSCA